MSKQEQAIDGKVGIRADGTVLFGQSVSCDGFVSGHCFRVQTHVHQDHMKDFDTSKGTQNVVVSSATRDLLIAIKNAEIPHRNNIITVEEGYYLETDDGRIELLDSGHMLGSVQVRFSHDCGTRIGYSSEFFWPLERVFQVDVLVVDSTYGDPRAVRQYSQRQVEERFVELLSEQLRNGPVAVLGYRGRIQHGMSLISGHVSCPILATQRVGKVAEVYQKHGTCITTWIDAESDEGRQLIRDGGRYVAFAEPTEQRFLPWMKKCSRIILSAFMVPGGEPILEYDDGNCRIALTDHADFRGTLEFVRASNAAVVITHPGQGNAQTLAEDIRHQLGIRAMVGEEIPIRGWG